MTGPIRMEGTLRDLAVNSTLRTSDGGSFAAVGRLDVESKEIGYNLDLTTVLFNANVVTEKAPRMSLSAVLAARGRGFDPETMQSELDASVSTSTIDTLAVDSSRIRMRIAGGMAVVDTFAVRVPGAGADITGQFGMAKTATGTLNYRVQVDSVGKLARYLPFDTSIVTPRPGPVAERLALLRADSARITQKLAVARAAGVAPQATPIVIDTPPVLRRDSLAGSGLNQGTAVGGLGGFATQGTLRATGLVALGSTVQNARAEYKASGILTDSALFDVNAVADSLSAAGFLLDSVNAKATYRNPGGEARVSVFQNTQREYAMNAAYAIYPDRKELRFEDLRFRFDSTRWVSTQPGSMLWGQPGIEVDKLELTNGKGGRLFADGKIPSEGAADLTVRVNNFEVGDLMGLLQSDLELRGLFSVNARIDGTSSAPVIGGDASVVNATYGGTVVPELRTRFNYNQMKLVAQADAIYDGRTIAVANGTVPINLATSGVTGSRLLDEPASVDMKADSLPLDLVSKFTDVVSETKGFAVGSFALRGPIKEPKITGDLVLANAEMRATDLGVKLTALNGSIHVRGDSVVIDSIAARSGGRLAITGAVGIGKIAEPSFDLRIVSDRARVLDNGQGKVVADANIEVKGPFDGVVVSGRARVREGVFYIPKPDTREQISAGDPAILAVADTAGGFDDIVGRPSPLVNNLRMDLTLAVDRDFWVRSTEANVEVFSDGDLRINIDRRRGLLTLDGVVSTDRGEYEFLSKRFQLKRGSATFIGTQKIDPLLQFIGEYEVKQGLQALKIRILIGGTMLRPRLTLESDAQPPIPQSDLLSYLAFGNESGSLLQGGGSSVSGGTAGGGLVGTSAALATKQLASVVLGVAVNELEGTGARSLGADVFNITTANIPAEFGNGDYGSFLKGTLFEYGKYFTTSTFVGLQLQGANPPGFRVEHRFGNRGLSLESTLQPRFFLREPSLAPKDPKRANAFGLFLVRRWKF
ncbi:MAG: translocation/assembly module TamB domain-containing protein [Phycisphaerae bacterium]|nr:translocation/assembly module TamB domain-containing protein [Gemmatimonadaceae bacterium]